MTLTAVSLFSGCMGLDLGLEEAGIRTAVCVENDLVSQRTIKLNRPDIVCLGDILTTTGEQLQIAAGGHVDILAGGPPCQSFSTIGRRGAIKATRGRFVLEYLRIVSEMSPPVFVMENVTGILSATYNGKKDGKPFFPWLISKFQRLGYNVSHWQLNALDYGSPQKRKRVVVVGSKEAIVRPPLLCPSGTQTLGKAISDLEGNVAECGKFSDYTASILELIPPGGNWRSLPPDIQDKVMGKADRSSGGLTAFYRRLSYNNPSPTLLVSPTQRATTLCHPAIVRPLSVPEYKRIQGFPDSWEIAGSTNQKYRQLGNAVPVSLGKAIGRVLCSASK